MSAPQKIIDLVKNFDDSFDQKHAQGYNEEALRTEFVNPFFEALGWDVRNEQGKIETYKDVVMESAVKVKGSTKLADYSFRLGGNRVFFVETKKPSVNLADNPEPAMQLRGYGWSAKLTLSILTDFEELAIYDCRVRPLTNDKPGEARLELYSYKDYVEKWDEIKALLSPEAIQKGSFERYTKKKTKGTLEVDEAFLEQIEKWRKILAGNIALRNKEQTLVARDLNFAVQKIIDRIIFLRICEDRGIEEHGQLFNLIKDNDIYPRLSALFNRADERYNSGLFHFSNERGRDGEPDTLTPTLTIDDAKLKEIIKSLYPPQNYYNFYYLSADILGQVYEQFLGKVIMPSGRIKDKPEVKKAGGVYYTPTYIVDYIVENTVGKLLDECKTPKAALKLKVLDPACGSGSFLIGVYQYLLDWYRDWYVEDGTEKHNDKIYQGATGDWRLNNATKREILQANIYGVDIDAQAVEVTKLSLLLKVLENETEETLQTQLQMFKERALPDLGSNIKCGNSLIGTDFYDGQTTMLDVDEVERINVFDWDDNDRGFGEIMQDGGFDAVIGNPPYIRIQTLKEWAPEEVEFYNRYYRDIASGSYDIYVIFIKASFELLNRKGISGFIFPNKFFTAKYGEGLRELLSSNDSVYEIDDFTTNQVFENVTTYTCLLFASKFSNSVTLYKRFPLGTSPKLINDKYPQIQIPTSYLKTDNWNFGAYEDVDLLHKLRDIGVRLSNITDKIFKGSSTGNDDVYLLKKITEKEDYLILESEATGNVVEIENDLLRPFVFGKNVKRYYIENVDYYTIFPYKKVGGKYKLLDARDLKDNYPKASAYLNSQKTVLKSRKIKTTSANYYKYSAARSLNDYDNSKIMIPDILIENRIGYDPIGEYYNGPAIHSLIFKEQYKKHDDLYFLGILNSSLVWYFITKTSTALRGDAYRMTPMYVEEIPIRVIDFDDKADVARHDRMVEMVEAMLELNKRLQSAKTPHQKEQFQRQIASTDKQIDRLVYELYDLTPEEIAIVEEA